ncbi:helix-turn-helix transcriptional regulator [Radicibacter daui]|uniref:helix-turn-helix transcriptional regulator n=1 Tax=Radicibacter daui TaxID=3064829 RepID=UPI0040468D7A
MIGVTAKHFARLRREGDAPPHVKIGRQTLYLAADVHAWLEARRVAPDAPAKRRGRPTGSFTRREG